MIRYCKKSTRFFPKIVCTCDAPLVIAIKKSLNPLFYKEFSDSLSCRQPESNRYGRLVPQDFKSCASASSAMPAYALAVQTTRMGLEPTTSAVTGRRSNQLSHRAI